MNRRTALDHPPLGLVMQLGALVALPAELSLASSMVIDGAWDFHLFGLAALQLLATLLQLAAGIAISRRAFARALFAGYCVASLALAVAAVTAFAVDGDTVLHLVATTLEALAGPLVIVVAPLAFELDRLSERRSVADIAAVLFVSAASHLIAQPVGVVDQVRLLMGSTASVAVWLWYVAWWATTIATAALAVRAGRAMLRPGPPGEARRALAVYLLVQVGLGLVLDGLSIISIFMDGLGYTTRRLVDVLVGLATSVAVPLAIWSYAKATLREPIAVARREVAAPLVWIALWFVPILLARLAVVDATRELSNIAIAVALGGLVAVQAVANVVAARAALRSGEGAYERALIATVVAVALLGVVVVWLYAFVDHERYLAKPIWPLTLIVATLGTLAWSQRVKPD